jgi:hypothetical protein
MAKLNVKVINEKVEYNGFVYMLSNEGARQGDLIQCFEEDSVYLTYGAFYQVIGTNGDNDMQFLDDDNNERDRSVTDEDYKVFRKSHAITNDKLTDAEGIVKIELPDGTKLEGTPSDLEKITRSMQALQAEQVATVEIPEEVEEASESVSERLQVGDFAKVVKVDKFELGDIVEIDGEDSQHFRATRLKDGYWHYADLEGELVKATDEEVLKAKQALLKEGDFARVIGVEHTKRGGFHDEDNEDVGGGHSFENGTIVELKKPYIKQDETEDAFKAYYLDGSDWWWVHRKDLEPLTKEEAEHIAREAEGEKKAKAEREEKEAERLKWAVIGREVGEIKDGDVVKHNGQLKVVNEVKPTHRKSDGTAFVNHENGLTLGEDEYWAHISRVELIVPVEQRFDTVG